MYVPAPNERIADNIVTITNGVAVRGHFFGTKIAQTAIAAVV